MFRVSGGLVINLRLEISGLGSGLMLLFLLLGHY